MSDAHDILVAAAERARAGRSRGAVVASLVYDSLADAALANRFRSGVQRTLSFTTEAGGFDVDIEVVLSARRISGRAVPAGEADLELRHRSGSARTRANVDGVFVFDQVPAGVVRLARVAPAPLIDSEWFAI